MSFRLAVTCHPSSARIRYISPAILCRNLSVSSSRLAAIGLLRGHDVFQFLKECCGILLTHVHCHHVLEEVVLQSDARQEQNVLQVTAKHLLEVKLQLGVVLLEEFLAHTSPFLKCSTVLRLNSCSFKRNSTSFW